MTGKGVILHLSKKQKKQTMDYTENDNDYTENGNGFPEYSNDYQQVEQPQQRSAWLTVLCIFTFIGSGLCCLGYFFFTAGYAYLPDIMEQSREMVISMYGESVDVSQALEVQPRAYYLLLTLLYAASVTGAAFMLALRKVGFHTYTIAQALLLVVPVLIIHAPFDFGGLFLTVAFVLLYATFLKQMR